MLVHHHSETQHIPPTLLEHLLQQAHVWPQVIVVTSQI